jgi:hypothetical protein
VLSIPSTFNLSTWYFVTGTFNVSGGNTTANFYQNGSLVAGPTVFPVALAANSGHFIIGEEYGGADYANIEWDEIRVSNTSRSAGWVATEYNNESSPSTFYTMGLPQGGMNITAGLAGWWKLNEGTGTVAHDYSGNGNNGTLVNGPTWVAGNVWPYALSFNGTNQYVPGTVLYFPVTQVNLSGWTWISPDI